MNLSFQLKRKLASPQSDTGQNRATDLLDCWEINASIYFKLKSAKLTCQKLETQKNYFFIKPDPALGENPIL